ncbi:Tlg2-vesicle protein, partial [Podila minutissima]
MAHEMPSNRLPTLQERIARTTTGQRITFVALCIILIASIVVVFLFERQIFEMLAPAVNYVRTSDYGMVVIGALVFATCIFPMFGYGVVTMIAGFCFGFPKGFIPCFVGDILGATAGFWLYRLGFSGYIRRKFQDDVEYQELTKAVDKDGFYILFLIRLSSFPFALLNAIFGAMTNVPYWKFIVATILSTPRLFLPIYIGNNISNLADPEIKGTDRTLKWIGNIAGLIIALAVGYYIYRHATHRIQRINAQYAEEETANNYRLYQQYQFQQYQQQHQQYQPHQQYELQSSYAYDPRTSVPASPPAPH